MKTTMLIFLVSLILIISPASAMFDFASVAELSVKHLREHLGDKIDIKDNTNENDRKFLYFKMGDLNQDMKLDGTEVLKFLAHNQHEKSGEAPVNLELFEKATDNVLNDLDNDNDGTISYSEYVVGIHHF